MQQRSNAASEGRPAGRTPGYYILRDRSIVATPDTFITPDGYGDDVAACLAAQAECTKNGGIVDVVHVTSLGRVYFTARASIFPGQSDASMRYAIGASDTTVADVRARFESAVQA